MSAEKPTGNPLLERIEECGASVSIHSTGFKVNWWCLVTVTPDEQYEGRGETMLAAMGACWDNWDLKNNIA